MHFILNNDQVYLFACVGTMDCDTKNNVFQVSSFNIWLKVREFPSQ